jgi:hypothetical protein
MSTQKSVLVAAILALTVTSTVRASDNAGTATTLESLLSAVSASLASKLETRDAKPHDTILTFQDQQAVIDVSVDSAVEIFDAEQDMTSSVDYRAAPRVATIAD